MRLHRRYRLAPLDGIDLAPNVDEELELMLRIRKRTLCSLA